MTRLKLDQWGSRWSFARGATKATHRTKRQSMTELTDALAEVDGLLAGINYLDRLEPALDENDSHSARSDNATNLVQAESATGSWFGGHLTVDLPQGNVSQSQERSNIEILHLQNRLNEMLKPAETSHPAPRDSQWATLRDLRKASEYYYNQFTRATADSKLVDIHKLRKSYVTAKDLLEMGILTFRDVLHGHIPTTLVDIFAFASLSYVISKTLHAKGHIEESEILSGILDWRAAIFDEREKSAFNEIARRLWPEAKEIMHFFPIERSELGHTGLRPEGTKSKCASSVVPQETFDSWSSKPDEEYTTLGDDTLSFPWNHEYAPIYQANTNSTSCFSEFQHLPGGLEDHAHQILQETMSHDDFMFSAWLNLDNNTRDNFIDSSSHYSTAAGIDPNVLDTSQTELSTGTESAPSKSPASPLDDFEEPPPVENMNRAADDNALSRLINNPLFQVVFKFITQTSEMGDLLNVLSGRGLTSGKNGMKSSQPCPPWVAFEFVHKAPKHFFGPLNREAIQIDQTFSGIVAMAEMFVRLGYLNTIKEVENYIITVGRHLVHSYDLFAKLVSETLTQCFFASRSMKWDLLYPRYATRADEYTVEYIEKRKREERKLVVDSEDLKPDSLEDESSPTSSTSDIIQKNSSNASKRRCNGNPGSGSKRRRRDTSSQDKPSHLDVSIIEHCTFDNCTKSYRGIAAHNNLSRHFQTEHNKKKLKCPNCSHETARRHNLRQHFLAVHTNFKLPDWIANKKRGLPS